MAIQNNILSVDISTAKHGIKAVFHPTAQIAILCCATTEALHTRGLMNAYGMDVLNQRTDLVLCVALQLFYSLRISEVLAINCKNIDDSGRIYIQCKKGSQPIVIFDLQLSSIFMYYKRNNIEPFETLDRFFIYRIYKKIGIQHSSSGIINKSVTHAFRHITAKEIRIQGNTDDYVSSALHHKSSKSQQSYGNK